MTFLYSLSTSNKNETEESLINQEASFQGTVAEGISDDAPIKNADEF